jgi:hypothetical protein
MPITFRNDTLTPVGLWDTDSEHHVAAPLGGSVTLEPTMVSQETIDIYVASGSGSATELVAPVNTVAPSVTGDAEVGSVLTTTNGTWTGNPTPTYTRAWQRSADGSTGWAAIAGATAATYTLVEDDDAQYIRCVVTATNSAGSDTADSNVVGPVTAEE